MADKKPSLHKTLFFLILVFVPPYFLIFTDEGSRLSDTALLWLLGEEDIKVDIAKLDRSFSETDIKTVFAEHEWTCGEKQTPFGESLCAARIGTFNTLPARLITFYFVDQQVTGMKVNYREPYHEQMLGQFITAFGQPSNVEQAVSDTPDAAEVLEWRLDRGTLVMKKELAKQDEASVLWLAARPGN
ncbi:hypothetical protein [Thiosocius teredinicola]|uniref:hypothetical protein n=1 Tax=Thiosocius teredinicola TaxID=1973002 RepID=UPI000990D6AD